MINQLRIVASGDQWWAEPLVDGEPGPEPELLPEGLFPTTMTVQEAALKLARLCPYSEILFESDGGEYKVVFSHKDRCDYCDLDVDL